MRLLIVGGAGYLGSVLIPKLLERSYKVDVVDLFWFGNRLPHQVGGAPYKHTLHRNHLVLLADD